jgi:hypothetical protein
LVEFVRIEVVSVWNEPVKIIYFVSFSSFHFNSNFTLISLDFQHCLSSVVSIFYFQNASFLHQTWIVAWAMIIYVEIFCHLFLLKHVTVVKFHFQYSICTCLLHNIPWLLVEYVQVYSIVSLSKMKLLKTS